MSTEEDSIYLLGYRSSSPNRNGRRLLLSDTELAMNDSRSRKRKAACEESTVFSTSLCDDSLPSMRAQLAATRMLGRSKRKYLESSMNEDLPLLRNGRVEGGGMGGGGEGGKHLEDSMEMSASQLNKKDFKTNGKYNTVGGGTVPKLQRRKEKLLRYGDQLKVAFLTLFIVVCVILFSINNEQVEEFRFITLSKSLPKWSATASFKDLIKVASEDCTNQISDEFISFTKKVTKNWEFVTLNIEGPFIDNPEESNTSSVSVCGISPGSNQSLKHVNSNCVSFQLVDGFDGENPHELFTSITKTLHVNVENIEGRTDSTLFLDAEDQNVSFVIVFRSANEQSVEFQTSILGEVLAEKYQIAIAAVILVWVYILIAFDVVHRAVAAFIGSTCTLAVLSMIDKRPSLSQVVEWIDLDTICLLFGMMTLVAIFSQSGFFDYAAVKAYKIARGKVWPLISLLCLFSAVVSAFLDNVTTILLLTPVSIRLCQVLNLDPRPVLIAEVVFSNIGGTATAIGDPPNVIIVSHSLIRSTGIRFPEFTLHLFLGVILAIVAAYGLLCFIYYMSFIRVTNKDPPHIAELKREVSIWEKTALRLNIVSLEERAVRDAILAKAMDVRNQLNQEVNISMHTSKDMWQKNLTLFESKYRITDWVLLVKSSIVLVVVILMFFLSHTIPKVELGLGWIAIYGAVVLLILANIQDLESVIHKIEWGTLLFFAGLFILMEGLGELGLIRFIGEVVVSIIKAVPKENQMIIAVILILWVSAIASSFIDNIPFTTATIPIIWDLAHSPDLCLSLRPLVWALALGACLGGNGTLIGASANVVCAGIAEQNGYRISFMSFLKIGFPMMIVTTLAAMVYLLICHSAFDWNITQETKDCIANS